MGDNLQLHDKQWIPTYNNQQQVCITCLMSDNTLHTTNLHDPEWVKNARWRATTSLSIACRYVSAFTTIKPDTTPSLPSYFYFAWLRFCVSPSSHVAECAPSYDNIWWLGRTSVLVLGSSICINTQQTTTTVSLPTRTTKRNRIYLAHSLLRLRRALPARITIV